MNVSYYKGNVYMFELASGTLNVTKTYTARDFIEVYHDVIEKPDEYVCNVFDSTQAGLNGNVSVFANGKLVYYKEFVGTGNPTAIRINGENLTGYFNGAYNIRVVYKRADGKEYSNSATIEFVEIGTKPDTGGESATNSSSVSNPSATTDSTVQTNNQVKTQNVVSLTLKKVSVKKSAKKLVLQATLKINKKLAKSKQVVFKFRGCPVIKF